MHTISAIYLPKTPIGILLDRYVDYLRETNYRLLIYLDGDKTDYSYRIDVNKQNSFGVILNNIRLFQSKDPLYYNHVVRFNSVLHERNSVKLIYSHL